MIGDTRSSQYKVDYAINLAFMESENAATKLALMVSSSNLGLDGTNSLDIF